MGKAFLAHFLLFGLGCSIVSWNWSYHYLHRAILGYIGVFILLYIPVYTLFEKKIKRKLADFPRDQSDPGQLYRDAGKRAY